MAERRLSVLQLLPALDAGGVERGTLEVAAELVRRGHRALVMSAGGRLLPELEASGAEHIAWPVGRKSLATLGYVPRLRRLLAERRPDILHVRSRLPAWIAWLAWRGMDPASRPRLVSTVHGFYSVGRYSAVMTRGERVIAVSASVRDYVLANYPGVDPARLRVIHRGVDPARYPHGYRPPADWLAAWYQRYPQLEGRFVVTLPGRLTRWKGQEDFIEIVAALKAAGLPVAGVMAGGAHPRKQAYARELEAAIRAAGLEGDLLMTGHRSDLREILAVSDVVLSLSHDPEAFGRTTIEALSLGRPVCGYDHGGVGEQLAAVLSAGAVPVADVAAVTTRLRQWYEAPPAVPAGHPFTLQTMLDATLAVYAELAEAPR
ncbi:glycosyltransferase family 4 protein [Thiohalobacter sp. IOR34]|uniref:glycosyltransferase family 4 protein n=1 Tax=Thiohalobacter sp. IOR34 TaxID=3057176 RepID=UPI0025AF46F0|nr:glycosyltransferase family 4 protein [Thiohalobacter sp. IOR34]WJW75273.1 glycosyltransferase family 4 protein [Thiohalobacter sp. IOR34]